MDIIANLEQCRAGEGLTPENLAYLENIFNETVGDKKEIDLEQFKKIVQSKNMFFVERLFRIFDADRSGSVSLEEFMRVMRSFAQQTPLEKLKYLFEVYDLNDDGNIQFEELRNVISECMKENGLEFPKAEIDELTRMLFEDADVDKNGAITFEEFQAQLQRYPEFLENLSLSIERWLVPPIKPAKRRWFREKVLNKLSWQRIRNNWTSVAFLLIFFFVNFSLFVSRAIEYRNNNAYVIIARACGQCLNFNCSFVVLLVLRQTMTYLRTHGFSQYFPIDQHLYYHKLTGLCILVYSIVHTVMHVANFAIVSAENGLALHRLLISTEFGLGWVGGAACLTGWLLLGILVVMVISAMPFVRRNGKFEVFYYLHLLSFAFWICLILHGPSFWKWFLGPAMLFTMEIFIRINRNLSSSKKAYVQQGVLLPSKVTHLVIKRPPKFDYRPGDYVYINIPQIAKFEWHPFTISSAPELDDVIWLHVRGVGEWTNSLHRYFERLDKEAVLSDELVKSLGIGELEKVDSDICGSVIIRVSEDSSMANNISESGLRDSSSSMVPNSSENGHRSKSTFIVSAANERLSEMADFSYVDAYSSDGSMSRENSVFNSPSKLQVHPPNRPSRSVTVSYSSRSVAEAVTSGRNSLRRTTFSCTSSSTAIQRKNRQDAKVLFARVDDKSPNRLGPSKAFTRERRRSVRVSIAGKGSRRKQTVIVMPTLPEEDDDDDLRSNEEMNDKMEAQKHEEVENIVVRQEPLKIFLDGPYGSPTRHIFQARHAVLIATGIGVTPFASILQSVMYKYRMFRHTCPNCHQKCSLPLPVSTMHLKKVDFIWLNRHQKAFEWFVTLLSELEVEQAQLEDRFLDIHMYITSALDRTDMKAVGLQMALDLLYQKEKRCLITGLKSRTQPGRPNWNQVFSSIANQKKGKVTVFFCGSNQLAKTLQTKCDEFGFRFRKEIF